MKELVAASKKPKTAAVKSVAKAVLSLSGTTLFEVEKGRKFDTIKIPIAQTGNTAEIAKVLKKEITRQDECAYV
ncbi:MAG: hypothetical protein AAFY84_01900 [Pseudomonadota bacterium]